MKYLWAEFALLMRFGCILFIVSSWVLISLLRNRKVKTHPPSMSWVMETTYDCYKVN